MIHLVDSLVRNKTYFEGRWVIARPIMGPLWVRIKAAWAVLTGRAEAVRFVESCADVAEYSGLPTPGIINPEVQRNLERIQGLSGTITQSELLQAPIVDVTGENVLVRPSPGRILARHYWHMLQHREENENA